MKYTRILSVGLAFVILAAAGCSGKDKNDAKDEKHDDKHVHGEGPNGGVVFDLAGNKVRQFSGDGDHFDNFVQAVRSRRIEDLFADIEEGHLSSALCHLGNVSYRLGEALSAAAVAERLDGMKAGDECRETFERFKAHLAANKVDVDRVPLQFGASLTIDPKTEAFTGPLSEKANPMLSREYRAGFEVPASASLV